MGIFAGLIEPLMRAAKFVAPCVSRNQTKVSVDFVVDAAPPGVGGDAFQHRKSKAAVLEGGLGGRIELEQRSVQIASWKQQAQSLLGSPHAVDMKARPHLGRRAKHPEIG